MTVYFTLPRSFQPADCLPQPLWTYADDARWLVSTIVRKTANHDIDHWGCVRLDSDILRRVMTKDRQPAIVRALVESGTIETSPHCAGVRHKGYRLAKRFLPERSVQVPATDPRLIARIEAERERQDRDEQSNRWLPVHFALDQEQRAVSISREADPILDGLPEHTRLGQHVLVSQIQRRTFPFTVSSTGRVFNAITGMKRELRAALRLSGEPLGSVDIVNAQPALLALLFLANNPP
jgi:hypothetical protein